jgi:hypothetical protein
MYTGKKSSLLQWEKVLKVMLTGKTVSRESLEKMKEMKDVPMYRLSSFIYHVKLAGGVVKVVKNGRKIEAYELVNIKAMEKYLANREKAFKSAAAPVAAKKVSKKESVETLADLQAEKISADVATAEVVDVIEVTEVTE